MKTTEYAQDFYAFIERHRNTTPRPDSRRKTPRTETTPQMVRRYRKGKKVQVMA